MAMEDDSIDQSTSTRRERLRALRAAKEYASMPDVDGDANQNNGLEAEFMADVHEEKKSETFEEDSTEQEAATRRERLMALRTAKELSMPDDSSNISNGKVVDTDEAEENKTPNMKFRNYLPHDKLLQEGKLPPVDLPKFEDPIAPVQEPSDKIEDPFLNIAPKKPNWDLRRDVQKKLDKLERRTQKALYELMLEQEKEKAAMELDNAGNAD
ncbi:coiled-coil domain-containing protein 12 isoform X2 [Phalaenopsis equestris]|uniref:coiled-coil domain-containing protein 12 isoform X2 n=1 Tax=Phalaenopsis equestris TaxID=78828 RepID=UPI0009E303B0|nr:coiled-coil domain-containing protein 12 isoform X2 [Phalaenopsis equestris]